MLAGTLESAGGKPSAMGRVILWSGHIPRGKARAPKEVVPGRLAPAEIESGFVTARSRFAGLSEEIPVIATSDWTYRHPILGGFNSAQWLRFVHVHHLHHEKIIRDIRQAKNC